MSTGPIKATLELLIKEAKENKEKAEVEFFAHDNHEDMVNMEMWHMTAEWLERKLSKLV